MGSLAKVRFFNLYSLCRMQCAKPLSPSWFRDLRRWRRRIKSKTLPRPNHFHKLQLACLRCLFCECLDRCSLQRLQSCPDVSNFSAFAGRPAWQQHLQSLQAQVLQPPWPAPASRGRFAAPRRTKSSSSSSRASLSCGQLSAPPEAWGPCPCPSWVPCSCPCPSLDPSSGPLGRCWTYAQS